MLEYLRVYRRTGKLFSKISGLKLAKECNEAQFKLLSEGPSIMYVQNLEDKLTQIDKDKV
jgi:hypothetical protein